MKWRFIHSADVHLDSPMLNLDRYEGAPAGRFREAARGALDNLVELAIKEQASFVIFAGDLYDGECRDINTAIELRRRLAELAKHNIKSFIVQGNHDAASRVTKAFRLEVPEGVHLLPTSHPKTITLDNPRIAIHGQGFETQAVTDNLAVGYPAPVPDHLNVGVLHTNCGGRPGYDNYAPSTVAHLSAKGYDYWALGHIHQQAILHKEDPWIVYPGNLQGRNIRETGPKGCVLVTVDDARIIEVEQRYIDTVRWAHCEIDISSCSDGYSAMATVAERLSQEVGEIGDRLLAARVELKGAAPVHRELSHHPQHWQQQLREMAVDRFDDRVWIEKIRFNTSEPLDLSSIDTPDDSLGDLLRDLSGLKDLDDVLAEIGDELKELKHVLPSDPRLPDGIMPDLTDRETRAALLEDVKQLLIPRLLTQRDEQ